MRIADTQEGMDGGMSDETGVRLGYITQNGHGSNDVVCDDASANLAHQNLRILALRQGRPGDRRRGCQPLDYRVQRQHRLLIGQSSTLGPIFARYISL
jgi:hypothetical protein